jgi:formylglycine-generating enzyme required for sulfatase activity
MVSWKEAIDYCNKLSESEGIEPYYLADGLPRANWQEHDGYRLPREAEWEFACRAGTRTQYFFGDASELLTEYCWHVDNSGNRLHPVGEKKPNDFGLFDIYGNVLEWCQDTADDPLGLGIDPRMRKLRGGSFISRADSISSTESNLQTPESRTTTIGLRVARTLLRRDARPLR